jgi:small GTP-binding protein
MQTYRVVVLGQSNVGKTSIIKRIIHNKFDNNTMSTVGACFRSYIPDKYNGEIKLEIWDTAGQERYKSLAPIYYRDADIILFIYDITDEHSFLEAQKWINEIENYNNNYVMILIGNKSDLNEKRKISLDDANNYSNEHLINYYEVSALNGNNIEYAFDQIIQYTITNYPKKSLENIIDLDKRISCCNIL